MANLRGVSPRSSLLSDSRSQKRKIRRPQHNFHIRTRPWCIQPTVIAPVLPGETMRNLLLQCRCVTDPVDNPLIGWWHEHYFFYVKLRDLDARDTFESMVLDPDFSTAALNEAASTDYYHGWNTINFAKLGLKRVVEEFFRAEGEAWNNVTIANLPVASIARDSVLDSLVSDTKYLLNQSPVEEVTVGGDGKFSAQEIHDMMSKWEWQRKYGLVAADMDFEAWLEIEYGVATPAKDDPDLLHRPELIRFMRNWSYPTNTVDPVTGAPTSALSWSIQERADKDRFFTEPGFLLGVTVTRPKVYLSKQSGSAIGLMTDAKSWLPGLLMDEDAFLGFKKTAATSGLIPTSADAYWVDVKDLLLYGDQFVNFALTETNAGLVALPSAALQKRYPSSADADSLFKTKTAGLGKVRMDGVATMMIASRVRDTTGQT